MNWHGVRIESNRKKRWPTYKTGDNVIHYSLWGKRIRPEYYLKISSKSSVMMWQQIRIKIIFSDKPARTGLICLFTRKSSRYTMTVVKFNRNYWFYTNQSSVHPVMVRQRRVLCSAHENGVILFIEKKSFNGKFAHLWRIEIYCEQLEMATRTTLT